MKIVATLSTPRRQCPACFLAHLPEACPGERAEVKLERACPSCFVLHVPTACPAKAQVTAERQKQVVENTQSVTNFKAQVERARRRQPILQATPTRAEHWSHEDHQCVVCSLTL